MVRGGLGRPSIAALGDDLAGPAVLPLAQRDDLPKVGHVDRGMRGRGTAIV
jgi:hypothetical protein